jgi:hypothetical protein
MAAGVGWLACIIMPALYAGGGWGSPPPGQRTYKPYGTYRTYKTHKTHDA